MLIPEYKKNADITVLNVDYHEQYRDRYGVIQPDFANIVYKDNVTGEKKHRIIERPDYMYYMLHEDPGYNKFYAKKEEVRSVTCKYSGILKSIAQETGNMEFYQNNINNRNGAANKQLHTINLVLGSDIHLEDYYRFVFDRQYKNEVGSLHKGFLDIETDIISLPPGKFVEPGQCPINAVTLIDNTSLIVYTFLLRNEKNPQIAEFEERCNSGNGLQEYIQEFVISHVGKDLAAKYKIDQLKFKQFFFDEEDEIQMIKSIFLLLHTFKPDFLFAWNMAFDMPYIIERCRVLGYDPAEIMSDPNYEKKYVSYYIDLNHGVEYELRGDKCQLAGDIVCLDQLIQFASRRKGSSKYPNYKLDTIGQIECGIGKLSYSHICNHIKFLPYKNYEIFVLYNIFDVIVQMCVEMKEGDAEYVYSTSVNNNTRYDKAHRQSYYLTNRIIKEFRKKGFIFGNNTNKYNPRKEQFEGALVNDPTHNSAESKMRDEMGQIFNIIKNMDDFDFKSLYPSVARESNMAPNTLLFKVFIETQVHPKENYTKNPLYDRGGAMFEDYASDDVIDFAERWLGLPGVDGLIAAVQEELARCGVLTAGYEADQYKNPFEWAKDSTGYMTTFRWDIREDDTLNANPVDVIDISKYVKIANTITEVAAA